MTAFNIDGVIANAANGDDFEIWQLCERIGCKTLAAHGDDATDFLTNFVQHGVRIFSLVEAMQSIGRFEHFHLVGPAWHNHKDIGFRRHGVLFPCAGCVVNGWQEGSVKSNFSL